MRNGDYVPTRLEAQHDAANLVVGAKTQSNPESTVGVIAMTGEIHGGGAELLISPTDDMGKILSSLHGVPIRGGGLASGIVIRASSTARSGGDNADSSQFPPADGTDIVGAIQVASLALKHRRNKNGSQRVVAFVGSPLISDARALTKCGRQLKKNNVAVDVICLGELGRNEPLLKELVDAANGTSGGTGETTCHLVTIPAGVLPSDVLVTSPIIHPGGMPGAGGGGGEGTGGFSGGSGGRGGFVDYGGVDPELDPELAMALRVSMEEERARQERARAAAASATEQESKTSEGDGSGETKADDDEVTGMALESKDSADGVDEDALLQRALAMSMREDHLAPESASADQTSTAGVGQVNNSETMDMDEDNEDAAMQVALQMSMHQGADDGASSEDQGRGTAAGQFQDQQFVNQVSTFV